MAQYLNPTIVQSAFERLASRDVTGKTHLERTSALFYFLAFDATCKHFNTSSLDLNPNSFDGKNNRKQMEIEFTRFVFIDGPIGDHGQIKQVLRLGQVDESVRSPDQRISSNFLTVPLKKASEQTASYSYPKRPAPILQMGLSATGHKWGVTYHEEWLSNFLIFFTEVKSPTPLLDLAIFIFRDKCFSEENDLFTSIRIQLKSQFSEELANFWISRIEKEKLFIPMPIGAFQNNYVALANFYSNAAPKHYSQMSKAELIARIKELESKLEVSKSALMN